MVGFIPKNDQSIFGTWLWSVDRVVLFGFFLLAMAGIWLASTVSTTLDFPNNVDPIRMVSKQIVFLSAAMVIMLGLSFLSVAKIRMLGLGLFALAFILVVMTHLVGIEHKGAARWLSLAGFSFQPTELLKPGFAILVAWLLQIIHQGADKKKVYMILASIYALTLLIVITQPDLGQSIILTSMLAVALFLAGLSMSWIAGLGLLGIGGIGAAYFLLDHVKLRIDQFFMPPGKDMTQVDSALQAFVSGGFVGLGPGEGHYKNSIADGYTDFIFAVIGEEYGIIGCMILTLFIMALILRITWRMMKIKDLFSRLAVAAIVTQFSLQVLVNMASALDLIPPKGMTLPFVSFGGSSVISMGIGIGILLALLRKNHLD